ncbi:MAG: hypothetical protein ACLU30_20915 [Odoribacter splanchnicus]
MGRLQTEDLAEKVENVRELLLFTGNRRKIFVMAILRDYAETASKLNVS